jgi:hypothetical protein
MRTLTRGKAGSSILQVAVDQHRNERPEWCLLKYVEFTVQRRLMLTALTLNAPSAIEYILLTESLTLTQSFCWALRGALILVIKVQTVGGKLRAITEVELNFASAVLRSILHGIISEVAWRDGTFSSLPAILHVLLRHVCAPYCHYSKLHGWSGALR